MSPKKWFITFNLYRKKGSSPPHYQAFSLEVDPDEYVLDAVERIWAFQDRSLVFRHACHHSTCGACGMRVNGVEKLTCITPIYSVSRNGNSIQIDPLRNFPVVSDLVVDMSRFYWFLEQAKFEQVVPVENAGLPYEKTPSEPNLKYQRLVDCIECGMCVSACPVALTAPSYMGPAALAAVQHGYQQNGDPTFLEEADHQNGAWRCHSAFECSAVCPSNVDPAFRIMELRRKVVGNSIKKILGVSRKM